MWRLDDIGKRSPPADYYRDVAAEVLALATAVIDPAVKGDLLEIAIGFLNLADHAEGIGGTRATDEARPHWDASRERRAAVNLFDPAPANPP
jgi:hypothetical protein